MGYFIVKVGSSGIVDKSLLPVDFQDGTMPGQLLVTGLANAWAYSPQPSSPPAVPPIFLLAGDAARLSAPVVIVQLALGGLGNLHEWRAANGSILARLDGAGKIQSARYILQIPGVGGPDLALIPVTGGQSVLAAWHGLQINALRLGTPDYTPANIGGVDDYHVIIPLNQAAKVGLGIRAKAGQTGDLQQWQDSLGAVLARISAAGVLFGNASGLTNVPVSMHTHPGTEITSPVASALSAIAVPWTGVTGKPATFPPSAHTHVGTDITSQVASAQSSDAVPWSGVTGKPATFPPSVHTHAGSDITSPVTNALSADAVPWTGVSGKPATFTPSAHTHVGTDITSPVPSALSANAVPWTGVTGKPATFPPSAHTHNGADIIDNTLAGSKLQDGAVTFAKLRTDQNAFTDLSTTALAINGGVAFAAGVYAFRLSIPNGSIAPFMLSVAFRNGGYEFAVNNLNGASVAVSGVFGATYFDFTNMFDGRTYRLTFNTTNGTGTINVASGVATGQTALSFRRIV